MHRSWSCVPPWGCEGVGAGQRWLLTRALDMWEIHCNREKKKHYQDTKQLGRLLRPVLVDLSAQMLSWHNYAAVW